MKTLIYTIGLPGSGKSTRAREHVKKFGGVVVNRDTLRSKFFCTDKPVMSPREEVMVTHVQHAAIKAALELNLIVICDDTNLRPDRLERLIDVARRAGAQCIEWDMTNVPIETCIANDLKRKQAGGRYVTEKVIRSMARQHGLI